MKKFLALVALIVLGLDASAALATTTIDQMTTGSSTLLGTEELPFLYPGNTTSYKTTAQQIANLGGGIPPGTQGNIPVNNGSGMYAANNDYYAAGYGAVCDGGVVPAGVSTTSGSPDIGLPYMFNSQPTWQQYWNLPAGGVIVISNPAQENTGTSPSTTQTLGILSSTSTGAVLNGNVTFNSEGTYKGASAVYYKTVNTTALQNAINAAYATGQGGKIIVPRGGCATANLTYPYPNVNLFGSGSESSVLILANGSNSDLLTSYNFSSMTNTGNNSGITGWDIEHIGLNGNKGANTGSGIGTATGTGDLLRFYGAEYAMNDVKFNGAAADGVYSEWNDGAGDPLNTAFSLNAHPHDLSFANNTGWAWVYAGPHDGYISQIDITNMGVGGILQFGYHQLNAHMNGGPLTITQEHSYPTGAIDLDLGAAVRVRDSNAEGEILVGEDSFDFTDVDTGTLQLGYTTTSSAVFALTCINCTVGTLSSLTDSGFRDEWIGGSIGTIASGGGQIPYNPWYSVGVQDLGGGTDTSAWFGGISMGGVGPQGVGIIRPCCGRNAAGYNLTVNAGGATAAQPNLNGGNLILSSGISTGLGTSGMLFKVFGATTSGSTDNTATQAMTLTSTGNLGIGATTTNPADRLDVGGAIGITATAGLPANGFYLSAANTLALSTSGAASVEVNGAGHQIVAGQTPSVASGATACGTSPSISGTDNQGVVVTGTSPSGVCVVTFATAWTNAPDSCGCTDNTSAARGCSALSISTTSFALTATTSPFTGADSLGYNCRSHQF